MCYCPTTVTGFSLNLSKFCHHVLNRKRPTKTFFCRYALCAVGATFAGELAIMLLFVIIQQVFLISKGVTSTEYHLKNDHRSRNRLCWNWKIFCKSGRY